MDQGPSGWHAAFAVCCGGMTLGLLNFALMRRTLAHIGSAPDGQPIRWSHAFAVMAGGLALAASTVFILQHQAVAVSCVYMARLAILAIFGYMLMTCDRSARGSPVQRMFDVRGRSGL